MSEVLRDRTTNTRHVAGRSVIYAAEATTIDKLKWYKLGLVLKVSTAFWLQFDRSTLQFSLAFVHPVHVGQVKRNTDHFGICVTFTPLDCFQGNHVTATLSGKIMIQLPMKKMPSKNGFLALGTETFAEAVFDNFKIKSAKSTLTFNKPEYRDSHLLSSMATS